MRKFVVRALATGIAVAMACLAHAQSIVGEIKVGTGSYSAISGSPFNSGAAISVNVGSVSQDTVLRFYSTGGLANLGAVTVSGSLGDPDARLSIMAVDSSGTTFPNQPEQALFEGVANCAGITISDTDLRGNTRVAIAGTGNLTGAIEVGHVFKLQFNGITTSVGEIQAAVTATAANGSIVTDTGLLDEEFNHIYAEPMAYVRASKAIRGDLTATAGDIGIVSIGVTEAQTDGLQANVKALSGQIKSIYCAGAIGNPTAEPAVLPGIWARDRIFQIIAADNEDPIQDPILAKDFYADVRSGVGRADTDTPPVPWTDGALHLLRTKGDFDGVIEARNITAPSDSANAGAHFGVLVGGTVHCPIDVEYTVFGADIIAASFPEPISIGVQLKGSVVATDLDTGIIASLTAGRNYSDRAKQYAAPISATGGSYARGFVGTNLRPKDDAIHSAYIGDYDPARWFEENANACRLPAGYHLGSVDSVIRAREIGTVSLRAMNEGGGVVQDKKGRPRIESPVIGACTVDLMRCGLIWSGAVEFDELCDDSCEEPGQSCVLDDPGNNFAAITELDIGCLSFASSVWLTGCGHANIHYSAHGEIHVDTLAATETIWIGHRLGTILNDELCPDAEDDGFIGGGIYNVEFELSPRGFSSTNAGTVYIHSPHGLEGQVIINGGNFENAEDFWAGFVVIGADNPESEDYIVLGPDEDQPYEAPHYRLPSGPLGGGAVGLAPFAFYPTDCVPVDGDYVNSIVYTEFMDPDAVPVIARWYGPVKLPPIDEEDDCALPDLLMLECPKPFEECQWHDLTGLFSFVFRPFEGPRAIGIKRGMNAIPKDGEWRLSYMDQDELRLLCDDVTGNPKVGHFDEGCTEGLGVYTFRVDADCNENTIPDSTDILNGGLDEYDIPVLDQNQNGVLDECEGEPCLCDWDGNHSIEVADIFGFLAAWFAGVDRALCFPDTDPECDEDPPCCVSAIFAFLNCWFPSINDENCNSPP